MATVPAGEVVAVRPAPAAGHGHSRGYGVVDGLADRVGGAHRIPSRLVRPGQLLDTLGVLARLRTVVAVRAQRLVQSHAVRHQPGALVPGVRGRGRRAGGHSRRARLPAVRVPVQVAYGRRRVVRLRSRPPASHDRHRHTAV